MTYPAIHIRVYHVQAIDPSPELLESLTARKAVETANLDTTNPMEDWGVKNADISRPETLSDNFFQAVDLSLEREAYERDILDKAAQRMLSAFLQKNNDVKIIPHAGMVILPQTYLASVSPYPEDTAWQQMDHYACVALAMAQQDIKKADIYLSSDQPPAKHCVATLYTVCVYQDGKPVPLDENGNTFFTLHDAPRHIYLPADPGTLPGIDDTSINPAKQPTLQNTAYMGFVQKRPGSGPSGP